MEEASVKLLPLNIDLETKPVLKALSQAHRLLGELKGAAKGMPNENILIHTLSLQEAKDSSEVESIVTTHDELYRANIDRTQSEQTAATKEVKDYREALYEGYRQVQQHGLITSSSIRRIQSILEGNDAGFRSQAGTTLQNMYGEVVYMPPQSREEIERLMANLEQFINEASLSDLDPLVKMAIIHHQFESIHPFYDGNGRTGRIVNVLYLVQQGLLDLPILYLSGYIVRNKSEYYRLLQAVREGGEWEAWTLFILEGVSTIAGKTIERIDRIAKLMQTFKQECRPVLDKGYSHDLLNLLFSYPYTKVEFIADELKVNRKTASKYLKQLTDAGILDMQKTGRTNYYINTRLVDILVH
ncbi:MAG: addiction module protein [Bacteroidetes bacterium]|nr:MAG: addiction module protein [Bacteroidota bacterium]